MIKQIIKAIKAIQEQYKIQQQINVLVDNVKSESVKIRIPKKYVEILEIHAKSGFTAPEFIDIFNRLSYTYIVHKGSPTCTVDITGQRLLVGSIVTYDFDDNTSFFTVVYENNAFRKEYPNWDPDLEKPLLEYGKRAEEMRLKIIQL